MAPTPCDRINAHGEGICGRERRRLGDFAWRVERSRRLQALLAPVSARRSAAALSSVEQPAADFTTFHSLESVKAWLSSLLLDEQNTVQALQRLRAAVEACTAGSGKQAKVQKLCQDWGISQKVNQQKRTLPDVLAEMTAKVLENASQLARVVRSQALALTAQGVFNAPGEGGTDLALEFALATSVEDAGNSTRVIDLTSGPRAKRQRLLLERGLFGRDSALDPGDAVPTNADSWGRRAHAR